MVCGRGFWLFLRVLRYGFEVLEMVVFELFGNFNVVWIVCWYIEDEFDVYIIVFFVNVILVLFIGEIVEEVIDFGFLGIILILFCFLLGDDVLV